MILVRTLLSCLISVVIFVILLGNNSFFWQRRYENFGIESYQVVASICKVVFNEGMGVQHEVTSIDTLWCKIYLRSDTSNLIYGKILWKEGGGGVSSDFVKVYVKSIQGFYIAFPDLYILKINENFLCNYSKFKIFNSYTEIKGITILPGSIAYDLRFDHSILELKSCQSEMIIYVGASLVPPVNTAEMDSFYSVLNALDSRVYYVN